MLLAYVATPLLVAGNGRSDECERVSDSHGDVEAPVVRCVRRR